MRMKLRINRTDTDMVDVLTPWIDDLGHRGYSLRAVVPRDIFIGMPGSTADRIFQALDPEMDGEIDVKLEIFEDIPDDLFQQKLDL